MGPAQIPHKPGHSPAYTIYNEKWAYPSLLGKLFISQMFIQIISPIK